VKRCVRTRKVFVCRDCGADSIGMLAMRAPRLAGIDLPHGWEVTSSYSEMEFRCYDCAVKAYEERWKS
jgi:hypothetical protein